ncbi:peroxiredoxin-like family protein [Pseudonocardia xinjiangensis]|uniref:thioredoxin-dependent peroxiredoxin n=1 Tax=Pseudonocardia xinjiangensis TaxID=75289 RepID=A0ABX1RBK8_9PSEU|nr:peroxiredoxin-like family protein [Pseudonocardia xinjiangensis]NMH76825.1 AhpC/TSA family protein [Pseudonocardia xinjiangensis]
MTSTDHALAARIAELEASLDGKLPAGARAAFAAEREQLDAAGLPAGIADVGTPMPDAPLLDVHSDPTTLAEAIGDGAAVVVFYRGAWCPYCNLALRTYEQELLPALRERGVRLVAISPQRPDGSLTVQETNELSYPVLSDPGNRIATELGILAPVHDGAHAAQVELGLDVAAGNADGTATLPMPTVVVVDRGRVAWIDVHPNYATRTESADILAAVSATVAATGT